MNTRVRESVYLDDGCIKFLKVTLFWSDLENIWRWWDNLQASSSVLREAKGREFVWKSLLMMIPLEKLYATCQKNCLKSLFLFLTGALFVSRVSQNSAQRPLSLDSSPVSPGSNIPTPAPPPSLHLFTLISASSTGQKTFWGQRLSYYLHIPDIWYTWSTE